MIGAVRPGLSGSGTRTPTLVGPCVCPSAELPPPAPELLPEPWCAQPVSAGPFPFQASSHPLRKGEKVPLMIHQFAMGACLGSFCSNSIIGAVGENWGEKQRRGNMLYPEKEKWSFQGGSVILQHKNTNRYATTLCRRSFKDVYVSGFQRMVPRPKTSTTPGDLLEMQSLRCPLNLGLGPSHLNFNKVPGVYGARSTWRSTDAAPLPKFAQLACGPLSQKANLQGQMAPGDASGRTETK